jgi:hypothetical protein
MLKMKVISSLFVAFNSQQQQQLPATSLSTTCLNLFQSKEVVASQRAQKVQVLLDEVAQVGQAGSLASEEERTRLEELAAAVTPLSVDRPARYPLEGEHNLLYSAAPGGSSGRLFGNVVGKVSQLFETDEIFYNRVNLGPVQIALKAKREIKNDFTIKVSFLETRVSLFGQKVVEKEVGGGKC